MDKAWLPLLGGALVAVIGGYFTYLIARRTKGGKVSTTEAETLWAQAQEMRNELRDQVHECQTKVDALDEENTRLRKGLIAAEEKILTQRSEILDLKQHVADLKDDLRVALREVQDKATSTSGDVQALKHEMAIIKGGKQ